MSTTPDRTTVLMDGPPPRVPTRVTEDAPTRGARVVLVTTTGEIHRDMRAVDVPYMYDEETHLRWLPGRPVPEGADPHRARLHVAVCAEADWYHWAHTRRRPRITEVPAYLVWIE